MVYKFFDKKTGSGASVNEELAEELHKPVINGEESMRDLKKLFGQQIQLKWDHCLVRIKKLDIYNVWQMFLSNMLGLKL